MKEIIRSGSKFWTIWWAAWISGFIILTGMFNFRRLGEDQFSYLAQSLMQGKLYFTQMPDNLADSVYWKGHIYWHLSPIPAVILAPMAVMFKEIGGRTFEGHIQFLLTNGCLLTGYFLARKAGFKTAEALVLAFSFCFASVYQYIAIVPWAGYFAQVLAVFFVMLALYESRGQNRILIIGILMATAFSIRPTMGIGLIYFLLRELQTSSKSLKDKIGRLGWLVLPAIIMSLGLFGYNFARFGNGFNNGYMWSNNWLLTKTQRYELLHYGLFQMRNIPTNFYYYFIKTLDPVLENVKTMYGDTYMLKWPYVKVGYPGTSFFVVSPIFIYILWANYREKEVMDAAITAGLMLIVILAYYTPGWRQVGPRYLADLLPFAFLILLKSFKDAKLPAKAKAGIIVSSLFKLNLMQTVFWQ